MVEGITGVFTGSFLKHSWNGQSISVYDENGKIDVTIINQIFLHMFKIGAMKDQDDLIKELLHQTNNNNDTLLMYEAKHNLHNFNVTIYISF